LQPGILSIDARYEMRSWLQATRLQFKKTLSIDARYGMLSWLQATRLPFKK
jgi:hypothetical protein